MTAYYNENDPRAAAWLRELIAEGHIAPGEVDERSIADVKPNDVKGFTQAHWFAGIGGWSLALRMAGWSDNRPCWTGSAPCQPFSAAGLGLGFDDDRHLWPAWCWLIAQCRPGVVFGEQVEKAIRFGWLDLVRADLEALDFSFAAAGLPAACVGAPHIRQRLWFVADCNRERFTWRPEVRFRPIQPGLPASRRLDVGGCSPAVSLADSGGQGLPLRQLEDLRGTGRGPEGRAVEQRGGAPAGSVGDTDSSRLRKGNGLHASNGWHAAVDVADTSSASDGGLGQSPGRRCEWFGDQPTHGFALRSDPWASAGWIACRDGKLRPVEPGIQPLAHGLSDIRVGMLRGSGNAIVPEVAAAFIEEYLAVRGS